MTDLSPHALKKVIGNNPNFLVPDFVIRHKIKDFRTDIG